MLVTTWTCHALPAEVVVLYKWEYVELSGQRRIFRSTLTS